METTAMIEEIKNAVLSVIKELKFEEPFKVKLRFALIVILMATVAFLGYAKTISGEATTGLLGGLIGYLLAKGSGLVGKI